MVEFIEITDVGNEDFDAAMDIYLTAFPPNERHPVEIIKERVRLGLNRIYLGRSDGAIVFLALLWPLLNTDFLLLDYMATTHNYRGKNIGSLFLQKMQKVLEKRKQYFIIEVEDPGYGENREERQRRLAFYKRNGAKQLKNVKFILPPLQGTTSTEMILMMLPAYDGGKIDTTLVKNLLIQIYKELYNRHVSDAFISSLLSHTASQIELV